MPFANAPAVHFCLMALASLCLLSSAPAQARAQPEGQGIHEAVQVRFDGALQTTHVSGRVAPGSCLSLILPQEWRLGAGGEKLRLEAASPKAALEVSLRSAYELKDLPQPDLAGRDAAFLQQDWEKTLGRPAQSVSVASPAPGTLRWTATWFDSRLPASSQAMTVETFIVPLSREWVVELSLSDIAAQEVYDALVWQVLSGLKTVEGAQCER